MKSLREVLHLATLKNSELLASQFNGVVLVQHRDGSSFSFTNAIATSLDDFYVVFTEHHGFHVYHREDVRSFRAYGDNDHMQVGFLGLDSPDMPQDEDDD